MRFSRIIFFILFPVFAFAGKNVQQLADDHFQVQLADTVQTVRILQITDTHLGKDGFWKQDLTTFRRISRLVEMYNPHLLALTGDIFTIEKQEGNTILAMMVNFFDSLQRPWLYVFGNHDPEQKCPRDSISQIIQFSQWGMLGHHDLGSDKKYDFEVDILVGNRLVWETYNFDSGSQAGFKSIKSDQIAWYKQKSEKSLKKNGRQLPALAFFHIPLKQYQDMVDDTSFSFQGENREKVCFEEDDGRVYDAFLQTGNIKATFCGHDHYNNYWGKYRGGIILAYGYISGEATKWAWPTGGKLIRLPVNSDNLEIKNVVPEFE